MASSDLQTFLEDRLKVLEPTIDLSPGSPAQVQFIQPVMTRLGTDPFETDIEKFLLDRFAQEFPDIYTGDPGAIRDTFIKPLILILEPFKRETELIKRNQSLKDPSVLSDEDADALVANVFDYRTSGKYATGVVRLYYTNPTTVPVEITTQFSTSSGLNFFPINPTQITAEAMAFNRQGSLYFVDVPVRSESEGSDYNVAADQITGVTGLFGFVRVTNPRAFTGGSTKIDTPTFVAQAQQALTERSLNARRGASARLRQTFQGELRAIQVVGAGDPEMQRDILVATSPGHAWLQGWVTIFESLAVVSASLVEGDPTIPPAVGDELFIYFDSFGWPSFSQEQRFRRYPILEVVAGPLSGSHEVTYIVRFDGVVDVDPLNSASLLIRGGISRKGTVKISSLASVGKLDQPLEVQNQDVHVYGHTDIYVRPVLQNVSNALISNLSDEQPLVQRMTLTTYGATADISPILDPTLLTTKNRVSDPGDPAAIPAIAALDFVAAGVQVGDHLTIEEGDDLGTYVITKVTSDYLYLSTNLSFSAPYLRYRITRNLTVNIFDPKMKKLPFGTALANDLQTTIGSNLFRFNTNVLSYGVVIGDTIRVLSGLDVGSFTVTGFDAVLAGYGVLVDRAATASTAGASYEIYTAMEAVAKPLVRIRNISVLDSSQKSTGIYVPPADPVAVVPKSDFTTAQIRGASQFGSGIVIPAMGGNGLSNNIGDLVLAPNVAAAVGSGNDRRYSEGVEPLENGIYKAMYFADGHQSEFLFPEDCMDRCSYFMCAVEDSSLTENFPPIDPRPGDALTLKNGPNKGSYLIEKVRKFRYSRGVGVDLKTYWVYFVKIYGEFRVDPIREILTFIENGNNSVGQTWRINQSAAIQFPEYFLQWWAELPTWLYAAAVDGGLPQPDVLSTWLDNTLKVEYEWGDPARGVLRSYFLQPLLFEQWTAGNINPTIYRYKTPAGEYIDYRPDPRRYEKHLLLPPRLTEDADPTTYPRDMLLLAQVGSTWPVSLTDTSRPVASSFGIRVGDYVSIYPEVIYYNAADRLVAIQTTAGSPRVKVPAFSVPFGADIVGNLISIEEGKDAGMYRVTGRIDGSTLILDRSLTESTPSILDQGFGVIQDTGANQEVLIRADGGSFGATVVTDNLWVTLFSCHADPTGAYYLGSYRISLRSNNTQVLLELPTGQLFPTMPLSESVYFVVTAAPPTAPSAVDPLMRTDRPGTALYGLRPIRVYSEVAKTFAITSVSTSPTQSVLGLDAQPPTGRYQPYCIFRRDVRRVNSTEMSLNQEGFLYYFDTEVASLSPSPAANITQEGSYLTPKDGTFLSLGYRHIVDDPTLTYSTQESGTLVIPKKILPVNGADSEDSLLTLVGTPIQISYEKADIVQQVQDFISSAEDRVTSANMLARHFLPAYVSYDANYVGGSAPGVIAKDIIAYIEGLPVETPINVSDIEHIILNRGGDPITPTTVSLTIHDWDRRVWVEFNDDSIGGIKTKVPYNGTPRVSYFVPGADASGQANPDPGERIKLTQK